MTGWKQKYLDKGYTEERAEIKAMRKFEAAVERAQQSQTAYGKSMAQDHPAGRYFAMFATSVLQNYRNSMLSFLELYRHIHPKKHGKGSVGRHVLTIMNYRVFQPLIYTYVAQRLLGLDWLFDDDDDRELIDEEKSMITALLLGNIQSVPLIGSVLTLLSDKVFMKAIGVGAKEFTYGGVLSNPLSDEGIKLEQNIDKWAKADDDDTEDEARAKVFKSVRKLLSGLPVETVGNYLEIMQDAEEIKDEYDLTERFWMVMGKSRTTMDFDRETREQIKAVSKDLLEVSSEPIPLN